MNLNDLRASDASFLTITQTTQFLRDVDGEILDQRTVRRACEDGQLPCVRVGRRLLVPREPLVALFSAPSNSVAGTRLPSIPDNWTMYGSNTERVVRRAFSQWEFRMVSWL